MSLYSQVISGGKKCKHSLKFYELGYTNICTLQDLPFSATASELTAQRVS